LQLTDVKTRIETSARAPRRPGSETLFRKADYWLLGLRLRALQRLRVCWVRLCNDAPTDSRGCRWGWPPPQIVAPGRNVSASANGRWCSLTLSQLWNS